MSGQEQDVTFSAEQASRIARIRARVREGVWGLRHEAALQGHEDALECGELAGGAAPEAD